MTGGCTEGRRLRGREERFFAAPVPWTGGLRNDSVQVQNEILRYEKDDIRERRRTRSARRKGRLEAAKVRYFGEQRCQDLFGTEGDDGVDFCGAAGGDVGGYCRDS